MNPQTFGFGSMLREPDCRPEIGDANDSKICDSYGRVSV
jgi:hypothetical protein